MRGLQIFAAALVAQPLIPALADDHASEEARVTAMVEAFMEDFNTKDVAGMTASVVEGAMVTVIEEREGDDRMQTMPLANLIASISSSEDDLREPIWDMVTMVKGPVATVSASFEFTINGMRSHCGTNVFNLVRVDGEWKIAGIAYSHIEEGCLAAPEGK